MVTNVVFDEPDEFNLDRPRKLIEREPGKLSRRLLDWGVVGSVTQAKITVSAVIAVGFFTCVYFLDAALAGPDIPPLPPSAAYQEFIQERLEENR